MRTLAHQRLAHALNRRAEVACENARMDEIERHATPLFYAVMAVAAAVLLWTLSADYRDVLQHKLDTMADRQQYERISARLAACANSGTTTFNGSVLQCKRLDLVSLK